MRHRICIARNGRPRQPAPWHVATTPMLLMRRDQQAPPKGWSITYFQVPSG